MTALTMRIFEGEDRSKKTSRLHDVPNINILRLILEDVSEYYL